MTATFYPTAPFAVLETRGRHPMTPVPPLATVLVDVDDTRTELVVTVDSDGLMVARLYAHGFEASGNCAAVLCRPSLEATTAVGALTLLGFDLATDSCVTARTAVAVSWTSDESGLVAMGSAVVEATGSAEPRQFAAVAHHSFNRHERLTGTVTPFPCHLTAVR
ncbi:MAG: hypothetical protein OES13_08410 [Acidimicrobiia bacterium]|nr:hypothetical protein [Acidimicrobiia bacterium]